MKAFRPIELTDRAWVEACRDIRVNPFTALSFPSLYSWKDTYGLAIGGDADFFVVRSQHDQAYYCPCGDVQKCRAFIEETCGREKEPHFLYLTREQGEQMKKDGFFTLLRDDLSEYIASTAAVALAQGHHITHSFRIKIHHFQRDTAYSTRFITEKDLPDLRRFVRDMMDTSRDMGDWNVVNTLLNDFIPLGLHGVLLETEDGRRAFLLGYENNVDEFTMTMAKHDPFLPASITLVIIHEMAVLLQEKYALINLEEDLGLTGLRQAKLLYSPVDRLNVYEAIR